MLGLSKLQQIAFLRSDGPHDESNIEVWRQAMISKVQLSILGYCSQDGATWS